MGAMDNVLCSVLLLCLVGLSVAVTPTTKNFDEKRLTKYLAENYDRLGKMGRPSANVSSPVVVKMGLMVVKTMHIDVAEQSIELVAWVNMQWEDPALGWNTGDFSGIHSVLLSPSDIWTPDVSLFNAIGTVQRLWEANILVTNTGTVHWVQPYSLKATCKTRNPLETHPSCELVFGSWAHNTKQMSLDKLQDDVDASFYAPSHYWELDGTSVLKQERKYPCCPETYGTLTFTFNYQERPQIEDSEHADQSGAGTIASLSFMALLSLVSLRLLL